MNYNVSEVKSFISEHVTNDVLRNVGVSVGILFVVVVSQLIIHEVVMVVDGLPVFGGLMQLLGLVVFVNFVRNNLLTKVQRDELVVKVMDVYDDVVN
jgi:hypothetical protein